MDFEKEISRIWTKHERQSGVFLSQDFRDTVEATLSFVDDETFLEDLDAFIPGYIRAGQAFVSGRASRSGSTTAPKRRYRKSFERRLYLLRFVVDHTYSPGSLRDRGHIPPIPALIAPVVLRYAPGDLESMLRPMSPRIRIDWQRVTGEWNEAHPSDLMTPAVLKAEFYRILRDDLIVWQFTVTRIGKEDPVEFFRWFAGTTLVSDSVKQSLVHEGGKEAARDVEEVLVGHSLPDMREDELTAQVWWTYIAALLRFSRRKGWPDLSEADREEIILRLRAWIKENQHRPEPSSLRDAIGDRLLYAIGGNRERLDNQTEQE